MKIGGGISVEEMAQAARRSVEIETEQAAKESSEIWRRKLALIQRRNSRLKGAFGGVMKYEAKINAAVLSVSLQRYQPGGNGA